MATKNVTVIGIGKLGLCFSLTLEKVGYKVMGIDVNEEYIKMINDKILKTPEPDVEIYLDQSKNFTATTDIKKGLSHSDIIFAFVATPSLPNGRYNHKQIDRVVKQLIQFSTPSQSKHLVIGCTTMPGYCDTIHDKLEPYGYTVSYNPEFIAQGSVMRDLINPDILLIGEGNQSASDEIKKIYLSILQSRPQVHRMSRKEAEITKIALNCFLTTKIAFANVIGDIALAAKCNPKIILNAIGSDTRIGNKFIKYGYGYGGPCLPRDNRALLKFAKDMNINAVINKAVDNANKLHLEYQVDNFIKRNDKSKKVVFSDISYKSGTKIIEESQKLAFAAELAKKGYSIVINDDQDVVNQVKLIYGNLFQYKE